MFAVLPPEVECVVRTAAKVIGSTTNDFPLVKGYVANLLSPKTRSVFQRRHRTTRKHLPPNAVELEMIELWQTLTGVTLRIPESKAHPATWRWQPSGWNLQEINSARRRAKVASEGTSAND